MSPILCRPKSLPFEKLEVAERRAIEINPANALDRRAIALAGGGRRGAPRRIAVVVSRKWPKAGAKLSVSFLDSPKADLRKRILLHMNAWGREANVQFVQTSGVGQVRIARLDSPEEDAGFWSYIGTEILEIEDDQPTLNLEGFTMRTSEAEFKRVVRHEAGHTLGFEHEHMRSDIVANIDKQKAYAFFLRDQDWPPSEVDLQVLTPLKNRSLMGTKESDPLSIMCYQLPGSIMRDRKPIKGGSDINANDHAFAATIYPRRSRMAEPPVAESPTVPAPGAPMAPQAPPRLVSPAYREAQDVFEIIVMDDFRPDAPEETRGKHSKYARVLASYRGARVSCAMRLKSGESETPTHFGNIIDTHEQITDYTSRVKGTLPDDRQLLTFGMQLFDTLFQGDVRRLYDEARTLQQRRLDLVFTSMIPWIADKPWEFAFDDARGSFLATEEVHFTRNVLTGIPADSIARNPGPLRILVASAQPVGFGRLSIDEETAVIRRGFEPLVEAGLVTIEPLARATPAKLHGYLQHGDFQVVHFIGHGAFDEKRGEGCLVFVNEQGEEHLLGERSVRELFCGRNLSLVFLNACETGRGGRAEFNKGTAQSLVAHGLPALIANQYSVLDSSATFFAQHFYWALSQGSTLGQAAREARIAVNYSLQGEPIDWAVPVLYARDPNLALCPRPAQPHRVPVTRVRASARRATSGHARRIAVWDMDNVFPALERTLSAMNSAQQEFGFELADFSVPLDVWKLDEQSKRNYLWAEQLVRRMVGAPVELGVDLLVCVTRHWMCSNDWQNIYGYTAGDGEAPISIFSVAGFDALPVQGPETDRVIANAMTAGLAEFFGDASIHQSGSKSCPLYFNQNRSYQHLSEHQEFDAKCRAKLKKALGGKLAALEALLNVFT